MLAEHAGLKGLYHEGITDSIEEFLENFNRQTVTSWGTRTKNSRQTSVNFCANM